MNTTTDSSPARKNRSITKIRESKKTGEKMVYMSVPDYTSACWAKAAGVEGGRSWGQPPTTIVSGIGCPRGNR